MTRTQRRAVGREGGSRKALLLALPLLGASCAGDKCEIADHPALGTYEILWSRYRPELERGVVEIDDTSLVVRYTLPDGSRWHVTYALEGPVR